MIRAPQRTIGWRILRGLASLGEFCVAILAVSQLAGQPAGVQAGFTVTADMSGRLIAISGDGSRLAIASDNPKLLKSVDVGESRQFHWTEFRTKVLL